MTFSFSFSILYILWRLGNIKNNITEDALTLSKEIIEDIETLDTPLSQVSLKVYRLAKSLDDRQNAEVFENIQKNVKKLEGNTKLSLSELKSIDSNSKKIIIESLANIDLTPLRRAILTQEIEKNQNTYQSILQIIYNYTLDIYFKLRNPTHESLFLIGEIDFNGNIRWYSKNLENCSPQGGLEIDFYSPESVPTKDDRRNITEYIKAVIDKNNISWVIPGPHVWTLNLDILKNNIEAFSKLDWIKGKVEKSPEVETFGVSNQIARTSITSLRKYLVFYISPEDLGKEYNPIDMFDRLDFHGKIVTSSRELFINKHYRQAVHEATISLENHVKQKTKFKQKIGQDLMFKAFNEEKPKILISDINTDPSRDKQNGIRFLSAGVMRGIKNVFSHSEEKLENPLEALKILSIISYILDTIDKNE